MSYSFPPEINRLVQDRLSSGLYASEDEILLEAMQTLRDRDEAVAAVQKGIADEAAGRCSFVRRGGRGNAQEISDPVTMASYQVHFTDRASRDLDEAYRWIAERSPEAANRWYHGFVDALLTLREFPERCSLAPENPKLPGEIRQLLYGKRHSYRVLFAIRADRVVYLSHPARSTRCCTARRPYVTGGMCLSEVRNESKALKPSEARVMRQVWNIQILNLFRISIFGFRIYQPGGVSMRELVPQRLWIGNAGDARDPARVLDAGVAALVNLAAEELPPDFPRDILYCHFPLLDGPGNSPAHVADCRCHDHRVAAGGDSCPGLLRSGDEPFRGDRGRGHRLLAWRLARRHLENGFRRGTPRRFPCPLARTPNGH